MNKIVVKMSILQLFVGGTRPFESCNPMFMATTLV